MISHGYTIEERISSYTERIVEIPTVYIKFITKIIKLLKRVYRGPLLADN